MSAVRRTGFLIAGSPIRARRWLPSIGLIALVLLPARASRAQTPEQAVALSEALQRYTRYLRRMDVDSIAVLFTPAGELAATGRASVVGPTAIREFLMSFAGFRVLAYETVADSLRFRGDTAFQAGRWWQRVRVSAGDTVSVSGGFDAEWVHVPNDGWLLRKMSTDGRSAGPWPAP